MWFPHTNDSSNRLYDGERKKRFQIIYRVTIEGKKKRNQNQAEVIVFATSLWKIGCHRQLVEWALMESGLRLTITSTAHSN